jgi:hypothetical protein
MSAGGLCVSELKKYPNKKAIIITNASLTGLL